MKKLNLIIALIALVGQVTGFVGIFVADSNDQLMLSLWTFLGFGCVGAIALITDAKEIKEKPQNVLQLQILFLSLFQQKTKKP